MEKNVLLITEPHISFLQRSVSDGLIAQGFTVDCVPADINLINKQAQKAQILILFADLFADQNRDVLVYIRDICTEKEKKIILLGYEDEMESVERTISTTLICAKFLRPLDVKQIGDRVGAELVKLEEASQKKHILVVDDSGVMLRTIRSWLMDTFKVSVANSAASAFTFLNTSRPDLILLDYEMPVCSGAQFLEMLRSEMNTSDIPVIFLTSRGDKESVQKVLALKPEGYLLKTTPPQQVVETIQAYFEKKRLEHINL